MILLPLQFSIPVAIYRQQDGASSLDFSNIAVIIYCKQCLAVGYFFAALYHREGFPIFHLLNGFSCMPFDRCKQHLEHFHSEENHRLTQQYFLASLHCSFLFPDFPFHFAVQSASYHLDQEKRKMTNHISSFFCFSRLQYEIGRAHV